MPLLFRYITLLYFVHISLVFCWYLGIIVKFNVVII